jgi:hypothetical protein
MDEFEKGLINMNTTKKNAIRAISLFLHTYKDAISLWDQGTREKCFTLQIHSSYL